ncbi:MAG: SRPBCC domain-containing protein [Vampirovibrio sp.]|nr:SRPBCC domain-containing protein [Vampirovibrio sp.]
MTTAPKTDVITLKITRTFEAPKALIWKAFTEQEYLGKWHCPQEMSMTFAEVDLRVGGAWCTGMIADGMEEHVMKGVYREITPMDKLVYTHMWESGDHEHCLLNHETVITVLLADEGTGTRMTFTQEGMASEESRDSHNGGWTSAFDNLAGCLNKD